jgi:hypothetical protein
MCETSLRRIFIPLFQQLKEFRGHLAIWNYQYTVSAETVRHWAVRWTSSTSRKRVPGLVRGRMRDGDGVGIASSGFEKRQHSLCVSDCVKMAKNRRFQNVGCNW